MASGNGDGGRSQQEELLQFLVHGWQRFREETIPSEEFMELATQLDKYHSCFSLGIITGLMAMGVHPLKALYIADGFIAVPADQ